MNAWPKPSPRFAEYVRKVKACGHWEYDGRNSHRVTLRHAPSGGTVAYATHDGGNDDSGPKNFATDAGRICGCEILPRPTGGRKRSRKAFRPSGFTTKRSGAERASSARVEQMNSRWHELDQRLQEIEATPTRSLVDEARRLIQDMATLADQIEQNYHPRPERKS